MRSTDDLTLYVYGLLREPEEAELKAHVDGCADCAAQVARIESEHRLFSGALAREQAEAPAAVLEKRRPRNPLPWLRAATAAVALLCAGLFLASSGGRPETPAPVLAAPAPPPPPAPREILAYVQDPVMGSIVAQDEEGRSAGELSLQSHRVSVEILDGVAKTTVEENFRNLTDRRLEGTLHFPLPPDASISRLALEVNGKMEEGTCLERERAREVFESIVRKMQDPALLEWMPGGIFKCRIFPIEPRSTKRVIVAYTQALPFFRGRMTYVYPLAGEKTRAHPPEELRIELQARFSGPLASIESPSHRVDVRRRNANEAAMSFAAADARPKNDFVVTMETADEELRVVPHKVDGDDGYFALFLTPRGAPARKPERYAFVLDVSASVTAAELEVQKRLVRAMMENRVPGDRFEILACNVETSFSGEVDLRAANDFMDRLHPVGASDVLAGLLAAPEGETVYIGKGTPTFGETDPARILQAVQGRRIRTIGVGSRANVDLLQKLGGHFRVSPSDDVPRRVQEIAETLGSPVLSDIRVDGGASVYDVVGVRDLFFGERMVATGRYRGPAAKLTVTGRGYRREVDVALPAKEEGNNYVRRLWAQRMIADLLAQGESRKPVVTELGVKHQIMTPYTSFLVLENEQMWKDYRLKREVQGQDKVLGRAERPWIGPQGMELVMRVAQRNADQATGEDRTAWFEAMETFVGEFGHARFESDYAGVRGRIAEGRGSGPRAPRSKVEKALEELRLSLDDVGVDIINRPATRPPAEALQELLRMREEQEEREFRQRRFGMTGLVPEENPSPAPRARSIYDEVRTTTNQFGGLEFSLSEPVEREGVPRLGGIPVMPLESAPDKPGVPGFTRFTLVSNGAAQSIDLPRLSGPSSGAADPIELRRIAESATVRRPITPEERERLAQTGTFELKHLNPPAAYTAKVEEGKTIQGQPFLPPPMEEILRRFTLKRILEAELSRDATGRVLGKLAYDPQTNLFIIRDTKPVLDRIGSILRVADVEPGTVLRSPEDRALRAWYEERVRRERPSITIRAKDASVAEVVQEFRSQTGWAILLPPSGTPDEHRIDEFVVEEVPARLALETFGAKAGLWVEERADGVFLLSRKLRIVLEAHNEDVRSVLGRIGLLAGVKFDIAPSARGSVTISLRDVPWDEALVAVAKAANLATMKTSDGRIVVTGPDSLLKQMDVRVSQLRFVWPGAAPHTELVEVLEALLTRDLEGRPTGRLTFDPESKTCVVADTEAARARIREVIAFLDVEPGKPLAALDLVRPYPPGVRELLKEARRRLAVPLGEARRDEEVRTALRRAAAEIERYCGAGRIEVEVVGETDLGAGANAGVLEGQLFAVTRDRKFIAVVRVVGTTPDRARVEPWGGLLGSRVVAGDRAERIRNMAAYFAELPEEVRRDHASRSGLEAIRAKLGLKE